MRSALQNPQRQRGALGPVRQRPRRVLKRKRRNGPKRTRSPLRAGFQRHLLRKCENAKCREGTPRCPLEDQERGSPTRERKTRSPDSWEGLLCHARVEVLRHDFERALIHTGPPDDLRDLVHGEPLAQLPAYPGHVANADVPLRFDVKKPEDFLNLFPRLFLVAALFAGHQLEELVEAQGRVAVLVELRDHREDGLVLRFVPERLHRSFHFFRIDLPGLVSIKQVKSLLDLLYLILLQPWAFVLACVEVLVLRLCVHASCPPELEPKWLRTPRAEAG